MNYIKHLGVLLVAASAFLVGCNEDGNAVAGFETDKDQLSFAPEGGQEVVSVSAAENWTASSEQEWIFISPATGKGQGQCVIRVDSTFSNDLRQGEVRFTTQGEAPRYVKVNQSGFDHQILVDGAEEGNRTISIPDFVPSGENYFDVVVTTNVDFRVKIDYTSDVPEEEKENETISSWLSYERFKVNLIKAKPRQVKIRFKWNYNTKWWMQHAKISFVAKSGEELSVNHTVTVNQGAAARITDDRAGDSIAVLSIARQLNVYNNTFDASKPMDNWGENIALYTRADGDDHEGKPLEGRVKYVRFYIFETDASIPYEVRYLTRAEHISFYGNISSQRKRLELGTSILELGKYGYLKTLDITAYGLTALPYGFEKLGKSLETLILDNQNFLQFPSMINRRNFPHLKRLSMAGCRRHNVHDLSNSAYYGEEGLSGELPRHLFEWKELEELSLSYNYFTGSIPAMYDYEETWTEADGYAELVGQPKVLPNVKTLKLNLNRLTGRLPQWLLRHPNLVKWDPVTLIFTQEGKDRQGRKAGFSNVPERLDPPVKGE